MTYIEKLKILQAEWIEMPDDYRPALGESLQEWVARGRVLELFKLNDSTYHVIAVDENDTIEKIWKVTI